VAGSNRFTRHRTANRLDGYNGIVDESRSARLFPLAARRLGARLLLILFAAASLNAAPEIYLLKDIRAGQKAVGRTVFAGSKVEEFQVEILGVLENSMGPKQSIILAKLSGGPMANTGVMQGMSGSPVYIDGKLIGAVALSFPQSKEAIAGIRPIEDMLRVDPNAAPRLAEAAEGRAILAGGTGRAPLRQAAIGGDARLEEIATPVSFLGFTPATLEQFGPQLRKLGLDPRQGVSSGATTTERMGDPKLLEPGGMISVQMMSGDLNVGADGTITAIDGERVYAFGHRFLAGGPTEMPFARAEVLTLLPSINSSFKISAARELMGTITADREPAIAGLIGRRAAQIPVEIKVGQNVYHMRMIQDRVMTPLLTQMAIFSAIDSTERSIGAQTFSVRGELTFDSGPVHVHDVYSGELGVAAIAAGSVTSVVGYAFQSGFDALKLKEIKLDIATVERKNQQQIVDLLAPRTVRPGEDLEVTVVMAGANGSETAQRARYRVPVGTPDGPLYLTVADATQTNLLEFQAAVSIPQRSPQQVLSLLNDLRSNTKAYLRVWRSESSYMAEGRDLPDPPPSLAMILARAQAGTLTTASARGAKLAEVEIPVPAGMVVSGSKLIQVEVKN
jgi:hypothetical protein